MKEKVINCSKCSKNNYEWRIAEESGFADRDNNKTIYEQYKKQYIQKVCNCGEILVCERINLTENNAWT